MGEHLHKKFSTKEVKMLMQKYCDRKIKLNYILRILNIKKSIFFYLLKEYRKDSEASPSSTKEKGQPEESARK